MDHVFTYGSLMFDRVWSRVVSGQYRAAAATLHGFLRQRVRGQDYPCLERSQAAGQEGGSLGVEGVLYLDVHDADLAALDEFEGSDYRRIPVAVVLREAAAGAPAGAALVAQTYLFTAGDKVEPGPWDPVQFERERMERFLKEYPPPRSGVSRA